MKMKKWIAAVAALVMLLGLAACGQIVGGEQTANPWRDTTEAEAAGLCPGTLRAPADAENLQWSVMEAEGQPALVQLCFDLNGNSYTAREQLTNDQDADISGMYYDWTAQDEMRLRSWGGRELSGACFRHIGEEGYADLCTWYDPQTGVSYSLSVTAQDLDGFDLQAIVEAMDPAPAAELSYEEAYDSVIRAYRTAYETGSNNMEYAFENGLSEFIVGSSHVGYALLDLDGDGTPELIVADAESEEPVIFCLWTLVGGEPVQLAVSSARDRYYLLSDLRVYNEGSGGAAHSMNSVLVKTGGELVEVEGIITAPAEGVDGVCFYFQDGSVSYEPRPEDREISSEEFAAQWEAYRAAILLPELTPIL